MLLLENNKRDINFLEDWPLHYYELPSGIERIKALNEAAVQGICTDLDEYRKIMCEKRFFAKNDKGTTDAFLNAWMMIKASAAAGVSFLQKKRLKRELEEYMDILCLTGFDSENEKALLARADEWSDFAKSFIHSCTGSKAYCSTLFGFVPIKDSVIAEKISAEIMLVTKQYPSKFGYAAAFAPLHEVMCATYCQMIHDGESYLQHQAQL